MQAGTLAGLLLRDEQAFWERYAHVYETVLTRFGAHVAMLGELVDAVRGSATVLDVGCGPGTLAARLAQPGRSVVGVDYNAQMLAYAHAKERPGLRFRRMDACRLDLPDASFGAITSSNMLYFVPDPRAALAEMGRVLAPGGVVALCTPHRACRIEVLNAALRIDIEQTGDSELSARLGDFFEFNAALGSGGLRNLFDTRELRDLVLGTPGLDELVALRPSYLGQNNLIVARKSGAAR